MTEKEIRANEREAIKTLLTLDLLLQETNNSNNLIKRIIQLIDARGENS